ncbi:protein CLMP1-like [Primulina huaijiensis]|uniref:protein CLMP1-like n=1 Tax=Primulina huaijiensis TaxID=1492673 RepID=UPI003CC76A90
MGKSGGMKKKATVNPNQSQNKVSEGDSHATPVVNGVNLDSSVFSKRAHELKEEGNRRFQSKDYLGALKQYEDALKLTPKTNPDRAVFHSNIAACLMHIKPIDYGSVISECTLALQVQPQFVRALLRRARAYEAIGKYELAMLDVLKLLSTDSDNHDGLEIAGRLRMALGPHQDVQQELQSRPSPAALGASALRGAPISGVGPCLPARPMPKKPMQSVLGPTSPANKSEKLYPIPPIENGREPKIQLPKVILKPPNNSRPNENSGLDNQKRQSVPPLDFLTPSEQPTQSAIRWRQLKLVYDHDIRLGQIPVNCSLKVLRDVVNKRFPMSKAVLIKYKDNDGDLVTITCTSELKMAESYVDSLIPRDPDADNRGSIGMLRLYIVEVSPEQEPPLLEGGGENSLDSKGATLDENLDASKLKTVDAEVDNQEKPGAPEEPDCKEMEVDDWLFEFAQLFRTHVGIDPDAHIDLHELGMELCSEALEETVTGEESQDLFDRAALKFQEVAALAFFNWGNVHMCEARKRIPIDESAAKEMMAAQLQTAYDWVKEKYSLAKEKYEEALLIKSDFYEGLLALGQQQFEMAKLHWSYVLAKKEDLSKWDPTETISLFNSAEQKMLVATEMWDKLEEQKANELKDPIANKKDELLKRRKKQSSGTEGDSSGIGGRGEISPEEAAEQAALMRSQMHLFWGNMLFERSQVEYKLGFPGWKKNLNVAVERFKLAGSSEADISAVLKNHCSNEEAANGK